MNINCPLRKHLAQKNQNCFQLRVKNFNLIILGKTLDQIQILRELFYQIFLDKKLRPYEKCVVHTRSIQVLFKVVYTALCDSTGICGVLKMQFKFCQTKSTFFIFLIFKKHYMLTYARTCINLKNDFQLKHALNISYVHFEKYFSKLDRIKLSFFISFVLYG